MNRGRHRRKTESCTILSLPAKIKHKMIKYQLMCGNRSDLEVFEKNPTAGPNNGGFSWSNTKEGFEYWNNTLGKIKDLIEWKKRQKIRL